jgi:hypothetical protein
MTEQIHILFTARVRPIGQQRQDERNVRLPSLARPTSLSWVNGLSSAAATLSNADTHGKNYIKAFG